MIIFMSKKKKFIGDNIDNLNNKLGMNILY